MRKESEMSKTMTLFDLPATQSHKPAVVDKTPRKGDHYATLGGVDVPLAQPSPEDYT